MANLATADFVNKRLHCHLDTVANGLDPIAMYQEYAALVKANASNEQNYDEMISAEGNESKGGGNFTPQRAVLASGVRIVPYDTSHKLNVKNEVINKADGLDFIGVIDRSTLTAGVEVDVQQGFKDVEIREVATGGALTSDQDAKLTAMNTVLTAAIESGLTLSDITRITLAMLSGKTTNAGTSEETFKSVDGTKDRAVVTLDTDGNRTGVVLDGSA